MDKTAPFDRAAQVLPTGLRSAALALPEEVRSRAEELRLRLGQPVTVLAAGTELEVPGPPPVDREALDAVLEIATQASAHTALERVRRGYVALRGGHRVGLCGMAAMEGGQIKSLRCLSSLNLRVARSVTGAAAEVLPPLRRGGGVFSTLILAPPGAGKTTLLRDLVRALSDGEGGAPLRVGVADERGELGAGPLRRSLGPRTDVLENCPKAMGTMMLLRGMAPQVLAVDEITAPEDVRAIQEAAGCGVTLLATAHGGSFQELRLRPLYRDLLDQGIFRRFVCISLEEGRRRYQVTDGRETL